MVSEKEGEDMLTEERQTLIADHVNECGICRVADLCELTASSESTIRRDLAEMADKGLLKRVHGGARSIKHFSRDIAQKVRFGLNVASKRQIAKYVADHFVQDGAYLYLDAGTTVYELVPFLMRFKSLTIVTNGIETAIACLNAGLKTIQVGGEIKLDTHAAVGPDALAQIKALNYTIAFVGANGLDETGQLTTPDPQEAAIKKMVITRAQHSYVLMDTSKIGEASFAKFADSRSVQVITDRLSEQQRQMLPKMSRLKEVVS